MTPAEPVRGAEHLSLHGWAYWERMRRDLKELHYELVERKTKLDRKKDMKARLGHSLDHGDALIQTFRY